MAWTDDRVELLKKLWMEGLSASQIAAILGEGVTRNAVIGKVHRLKLSGRVKPASTAPRARKPRPSIPKRSASGAMSGAVRRHLTNAPMIGATALKIQPEGSAEIAAAPEQVAEIYIEPENRLDLLSLNEQTCKWPIGDPMTDDFYFCGQEPNDNKPYCEFHSRRAYHTMDRKRR
ncbi:MAG: GcrA cell cycle regulator [Alphaproteobacteria bacterium]|nr:GcrA cell cycle regulator [Alphaproteobacteria bacterium]